MTQGNDVEVGVWHLKSGDHQTGALYSESDFLGASNKLRNLHKMLAR